MSQPIETFRQTLEIDESRLPPRSYIYCSRCPPGDVFRPSADRARLEGWPYVEMDASHNPHITAPDGLAEVLDRLV
jgi:hypothetical protein